MLHNQVSALRKELGRNGRLETHGSAYRLNVQPGERDVDRFEQLLADGRAQLESDPEGAAAKLREALSLWRGTPLSDLAYERFAQAEIARLERRWTAFEARVEAELALGRHADLVSELEAAVADQPSTARDACSRPRPGIRSASRSGLTRDESPSRSSRPTGAR